MRSPGLPVSLTACGIGGERSFSAHVSLAASSRPRVCSVEIEWATIGDAVLSWNCRGAASL